MRICCTCKVELDEMNFAKRGKTFQGNCKECHKKYRKKHYEDNKEKYKEKAVKYRKLYNECWKKYKKTLNGCSVCEEKDSYCLDFHHTKDKEGGIRTFVYNSSLEKLAKEIGKCIILCSNCHRKVHAGHLDVNKYQTISEEKCKEIIELVKSEIKSANIRIRKNELL